VEPLSRAVGRLPARWRRALWLTEVEGREPEEMAALLGMDEAAAAALARRAREGLRLAYLLVQLRPGTPAECRETVDRLPAYARRALPPAVAEQVMDHLEACAFCRARSGEFTGPVEDLRGPLRPVLLGSDIGQAAPASASASAPVPDRPAEVPAPRRNGPRNDRRNGRWSPRRKHAAAAACVAVALAAVVLIAAVSLRPGRTSSQGSPPAAAGVPSTTTRAGGSPLSARPTTTRPRVESAAPGSARADDRLLEQRARAAASRAAASRAAASRASAAPGGGGTPPASTAPAPDPTTAPSSAPRKVCVGVLVVRLCRGFG